MLDTRPLLKTRLRPGREAWKALAVAAGSAGQISLSAAAALLTTFMLPVDDRGDYVLVQTLIAVTAPLAGLGSNVGLRRRLPSADDRGSVEVSYLWFSSMCAAGHALISPALLWLVTGRRVPHTCWELSAVAGLALTQVLNWQFVELWYGRGRFVVGAVYAVANSAAMFLGACSAVAFPRLVWVLCAQGLATLSLQTVHGLHLWKSAPRASVRASDFATRVQALLVVGAPSLVMTAGMSLTFRLDRLILGMGYGPGAVAVYALAGSFAELPRVIPAAVGQVANGHAARSRQRLGLSPYLYRSAALTAVTALAAGAVGTEAIRHAGASYTGATAALLVLLLAEILLVPYSIVIRIILGGGRVNLSATVGLIAIAVSGAVYWFSVSRYGIMGAAWASVVVYLSVSATCLIIHFRQPKL